MGITLMKMEITQVNFQARTFIFCSVTYLDSTYRKDYDDDEN